MTELATELAQSETGYLGGADSEPVEPVQPKKHRPRDLVERAVFVSIKLGRPGVSKKINSDRIVFDSEAEFDESELRAALESGELSTEEFAASSASAPKVDRRMIAVSKKLIDCKEYKAISTLDGKIKKYIKSRCTSSLIRNGIFLLPLDLVAEVDEKVAALKEKRAELVAAYGAVYPNRVDEALERLGPEGNRADYPAWERVQYMFTFDMQYLSLAAPTVLGNINEKILAREQEKVAAQFKNAVEMSCASLREGMAELVASLSDQLATDPTGQKKSIRKVSVEKMVDFLTVFDARNLADDAALAQLVEKAKGLLEGADVKSLRSDDAIRAEVAKGFAEIRETLSTLVVEKPSRAITFDD